MKEPNNRHYTDLTQIPMYNIIADTDPEDKRIRMKIPYAFMDTYLALDEKGYYYKNKIFPVEMENRPLIQYVQVGKKPNLFYLNSLGIDIFKPDNKSVRKTEEILGDLSRAWSGLFSWQKEMVVKELLEAVIKGCGD